MEDNISWKDAWYPEQSEEEMQEEMDRKYWETQEKANKLNNIVRVCKHIDEEYSDKLIIDAGLEELDKSGWVEVMWENSGLLETISDKQKEIVLDILDEAEKQYQETLQELDVLRYKLNY